ncbi:type II toxin-antitoxin system VapC family toxin [Inquilinus limosus]|uniref:type II toxin-antitoxin system VapC family toxin n=1 Tax=Inquilinus limosus TaxID=171674 RepID=UPI003F18CCC6
MSLVIDASVALKWVLDEPGQEAADALLDRDLIAPSLWLIEAANALWRRSARGELTAAEADERLTELMQAPVAATPIEADIAATLALAAQLGHPVYDCLYLALAIREDTLVVTADARFHSAARGDPALVRRVLRLGEPLP